MRAILCLLMLASAFSASAADYTFTGYARDLDSGDLLYIEQHSVTEAGTAQERREVVYRANETSAPFARKSLSYSADRARPTFDFADQRSGFNESVTREANEWRVTARAGGAAQPRVALLRADEVAVIDAGFDEFVRARWDELQGGDSVDAPFLVPSRLNAVNFRLRKIGEANMGGAPATVIRLSLAGALGWLLPDIDVTYRDSDRRLLRYRGLTNIRDAKGKLLTAQIDFPDAAGR